MVFGKTAAKVTIEEIIVDKMGYHINLSRQNPPGFNFCSTSVWQRS
jgi:hypothetical protein